MDLSHLVLYKKHEEILAEIEKISASLEKRYKGKEVIIIGTLNGAFQFYTDLVRTLKFKFLVDFMGCSSYHNNQKSDKITINKHLKYSVADRHVIIVDDIIDSGRSMNFLMEFLQK